MINKKSFLILQLLEIHFDAPPSDVRLTCEVRRTWIQSLYGTGSKPPGFNGWQRKMRARAKRPPGSSPNRSSASTAYWEHDGWKRQDEGSSGDNSF
jgi:hypothetical protein